MENAAEGVPEENLEVEGTPSDFGFLKLKTLKLKSATKLWSHRKSPDES